jgi:lysophospholipase L1-like esterase
MNPSEIDPPNEPSALVLTRRARRRLLGAAFTLMGLLALPYVVPPLEPLRPWHPDGGYMPFWNITARPSRAQQALEQEQLADFEKIAVATEDAPSVAAREAPSATAAPPEAPAIGRGRRLPAPRQAEPAEAATPDVSLPATAPDDAPVTVFPEYPGHPDDDAKVGQPIEHPEALAHYFGQLTLTDLQVEGAITRAGQWGDSVLGGDGLTNGIRKRLQERFGDAGHGFHALSRYSIGYFHRGVRFQDRGGWRSCEIIFKCRPDARYGYAGVHSGSASGGRSTWQTTKEPPGDRVSRFELWYQKSQDGGRFELTIDDAKPIEIDTRAPAASDAVEVFPLEDGPHSFELRAAGGGAARGYGVVLERDVPGVVWDELSLIGSFTQRLDYQNAEHLGRQLRRRDIDLMVFIFGGNDVQREDSDLRTQMRPYEAEYTRVLRKFRAGRPEASCLVMSLIDHGERSEGAVRTRSIVPRLVASQRKVAGEVGCAFFDTFPAMGGVNSIARWLRARPQLAAPDFSHPTLAGQGVIATLLYRALMHEYAEFRRKNVGAPLPQLSSPGSLAGGDEAAADAARDDAEGGRPQGSPAEPIAADAGSPAPR